MSQPLRPKFIASLTFRGFTMPSTEVESLVGVAATELGTAGSPLKPGTSPLERSFAQWEMPFPDSTRLDEMLPALISQLGGAEHLVIVRGKVVPEFLEVDLALWVKDSDEQEGGSIQTSSIAMLAQIGATLGIGIYSRNDA